MYGVEARILYNEEHPISDTLALCHAILFSTPRATAIHWAESERQTNRLGREHRTRSAAGERHAENGQDRGP
jgi:hypothetical protein